MYFLVNNTIQRCQSDVTTKPNLITQACWVPKLHKNPSKQRYIAVFQ